MQASGVYCRMVSDTLLIVNGNEVEINGSLVDHRRLTVADAGMQKLCFGS